jgi:glycosyltransferase involved in cell wall biosynthesis
MTQACFSAGNKPLIGQTQTGDLWDSPGQNPAPSDQASSDQAASFNQAPSDQASSDQAASICPKSEPLLVVAQDFPPLRTSGAQQIEALVFSLADHGHQVTVLTFSDDPKACKVQQLSDKIQVVRLPTLRARSSVLLWRLILETLMAFCVWRWVRQQGRSLPGWWNRLSFRRKNKVPSSHAWSGVIWYSPSIFLGFGLWACGIDRRCPKYLILRDIYPDWARDLGLVPWRIAFTLLDWVARRQYHLASRIGIQSPSNRKILTAKGVPLHKVEVLANWQPRQTVRRQAPADLLALMQGKRVILYAGNMGLAQDVEGFLAYAACWTLPKDVCFVFVGRGSQQKSIKDAVKKWPNLAVFFHCEIPPEELQDVFSRACLGLICLSWAHQSHNIPGKLMTYLHAGLPVAAWTPPSSDLADLITQHTLGLVFQGPGHGDKDRQSLLDLLDAGPTRPSAAHLGAKGQELFSCQAATQQILRAMGPAQVKT